MKGGTESPSTFSPDFKRYRSNSPMQPRNRFEDLKMEGGENRDKGSTLHMHRVQTDQSVILPTLGLKPKEKTGQGQNFNMTISQLEREVMLRKIQTGHNYVDNSQFSKLRDIE